VLAAGAASLALAGPQDRELIQVESRRMDGELLISVSASDKPLDHIVGAIAHEAGLAVSGFEGRRQRLVTVDLVDRPVDMVLEFVLGTVGLEFDLEGNHVAVLGHDPEDLTTLRLAAGRSYQRALNAFPASDQAPAAYLAQAWLAEQAGDLGGAINLYQVVATQYPNYPELAAAEYHTARLHEALGSWRDAVLHYDRLSELKVDHDFHAGLRLGQARCKIELGDPAGAIFLLQNLDLHAPALDDDERAARILVHAQANNARYDYHGALADLDRIDQLRSFLVTSPEYQRNTAIALEGLELFGPAGRAWLAYAERAQGSDQRSAVELAVELFLDADDEAAALYAVRFGKQLGGSSRLDALEQVIEERLGMDRLELPEGGSRTGASPNQERLARAEAAWSEDDLAGAYSELAPLIADPRGLTESDRAGALCLWARCLERLEGLPQAIDVLRANRAGLDSLDNRMRLDVVAAELFEAHELFDAAVDAYAGTYQ
jgi:tetratricopeptide (TPR) repeat protein